MIIDSEHPVLPTLTNQFSTGRCPNGVGAIEIVSRSSRIAARIYVNDRKVYGIDISNFPLEVIRRIITSEHISETNRNILLSVFSENLADPKIVDYILENQMIPPSVIVVYLKDIFLGACDYVASIPNAEITWRPSVVPKSTPVPEVDLDKLWSVVAKRRAEFMRMAEVFGLDEGQVRNLKFKRVENADTQISQLIANIYSLATGEWTLLDFARQFGISLFLATREIQSLWVNKKLNVIYENEFKLNPPTVIANVNAVPTSMKAKETAAAFLPPRPENLKKNPSTDITVLTPTPIPMVESVKETPEDFITSKDATSASSSGSFGSRIASISKGSVAATRSMDESDSIISKIRKDLLSAQALIKKSLDELEGLN